MHLVYRNALAAFLLVYRNALAAFLLVYRNALAAFLLHGRDLSSIEIAQRLRRLARDAKLLVRSTHRPEVAPGAGTLVRGGREEAELNRAVDDLQRLDASAPRLRQQRNRPNLVPACRRAEEQARFRHRFAHDLLDCRRVEDRLQRPATADHQCVFRAVLPRLVIRHAQDAGLLVLFDEIHRAAQLEPSVNQHFLALASRVAFFR